MAASTGSKNKYFRNMLQKRRLTKEQAMQKIRQYTAYQERCHQEVKEKLYSYGLYSKEVDEILATLIDENYLNEERFAEAFAGGKFRIRQWGRVKIRYELKQKRVSDYCIRKAMLTIAESEYVATLKKIAEKKWSMLSSEQNRFTKKAKAIEYLLQKGYEMELARSVIQDL
jgi:regulatory protein